MEKEMFTSIYKAAGKGSTDTDVLIEVFEEYICLALYRGSKRRLVLKPYG